MGKWFNDMATLPGGGWRGDRAFGAGDQAEAVQQAGLNQLVQEVLGLAAIEIGDEAHEVNLSVLVKEERDSAVDLGSNGAPKELKTPKLVGNHGRRLGGHVGIGSVFAGREVQQSEAVPGASSMANLQGHLQYQAAVQGLERASREELVEVARKMAYHLFVVEPETRRRLVAMDLGSAARQAQAAVIARRVERENDTSPVDG